MLAVAATGAALACLSVASATVAVVPAAIDLSGGTSVPTPSSTPQVNVPSVSVGPVQTPSASVPSEPLPSTGGDPPPPTSDPPRGGSGSGGSSSGGAQTTSSSSGSHTVRPLRPRPGGGSTGPGGEGSSHVRIVGGRSGAGAHNTGARGRAPGAFGAGTRATAGLFGVPGSAPPAAGLSSRPLSRSAPLDVSVRHALSSAAHQVARFDPREAIREATGWRPSLVTMTLLVIAFGLLVFASGSVAIMRGGRDQRPAA